jgi:hypothetical protein
VSSSNGANQNPDPDILSTDRSVMESGLVSLYARRIEVVAATRREMNADFATSFVTVPFGRPIVEPIMSETQPAEADSQPIQGPWDALRRRLSTPATSTQGKLATT